MTRDEFSAQLQELIQSAYRDQLRILDVWSTVATQLKLVEMVMEIEFCTRMKKEAQSDE